MTSEARGPQKPTGTQRAKSRRGYIASVDAACGWRTTGRLLRIELAPLVSHDCENEDDQRISR